MTAFLQESKLFILSSVMLLVLIVGASRLQQEYGANAVPAPVAGPQATTSTTNTDTAVAPPQAQSVQSPASIPRIRGVYNEEEDDD